MMLIVKGKNPEHSAMSILYFAKERYALTPEQAARQLVSEAQESPLKQEILISTMALLETAVTSGGRSPVTTTSAWPETFRMTPGGFFYDYARALLISLKLLLGSV